MALLFVVASTHFIPVTVEDTEIHELASQLDPEERLLYDMVSTFHGRKAVFPVKPHNLLSSDDKGQYVFVGGVDGKPDEFHFTS